MIESILSIGVSNAILAAALYGVIWIVTRRVKSAPLAFALWLVVLAKLITPPLFRLEVETPYVVVETERPKLARTASVSSKPAKTSVPSTISELVPLTIAEETHSGVPTGPPQPPLPPTSLPELGDDELAWAPAELDTTWVLPPPASRELPTVRFEKSIVPVPPMAPEPPTLGPASSDGIALSAILVALWGLGSLVYLSVAGARILRFHGFVRRAAPAPAEFTNEVQSMAESMGLKRRPEVRVVAAAVSPLVWTFGRPCVIFPQTLLSRLSAEERRTLIAHELAHLCRRDDLLRWIELGAVALYWWFPIAWLTRRQLRASEEECCDAWVAWALPETSRVYARALLHTMDFLSETDPALPPASSGVGHGSFLRRRFQMILSRDMSRRLALPSRFLVVAIAALSIPWSLVPANAQARRDPKIEPEIIVNVEDAEPAIVDPQVSELDLPPEPVSPEEPARPARIRNAPKPPKAPRPAPTPPIATPDEPPRRRVLTPRDRNPGRAFPDLSDPSRPVHPNTASGSRRAKRSPTRNARPSGNDTERRLRALESKFDALLSELRALRTTTRPTLPGASRNPNAV
ncbi:MAG: M56 family metallopeptidase, partial [Planctomycetota bacterium]